MNEQQALKASLVEFFKDRKNLDRVLPIINRTSPLSLRLLDWFIVCYSREKRVVYRLDNSQLIDVYASYRAQLKQYSKKFFDPFKRSGRFHIEIADQVIESTIGQLCFFRWAIQTRVLDYIDRNAHIIADEMKQYFADEASESTESHTQGTTSNKKISRKKKNSRLHVTAVRTSHQRDTKIVLNFD